jgi:hypothetical protein
MACVIAEERDTDPSVSAARLSVRDERADGKRVVAVDPHSISGESFNPSFFGRRRMLLDRLRTLFGASDDEDRELYRCVNCGDEFERPHQECPACGGPYVAAVGDDSPKA